ncbi:ATP-binding protein [Streptomyces sp. NBC_01619]|uniref:ATP-binding protein n=1 Tax=Streptomyces sp. NBC_01619 TaxID=2975901 RepID=UPI002257E3C2|nr:ATP-binding protein [Streptomyces sp. NBC_01619]MCX4515812.1 ATP-binding protein [Streptomyces sp. NBC_01619]
MSAITPDTAAAKDAEFCIPLDSDSTAPALSRRVVGAALARCGADLEAASDVLLVVSELVTNAVEHALPPLTLRIHVHFGSSGDQWVQLDVYDCGCAATHGSWIASCDDDEHGRGSTIVDSLATRVGSDQLDEGVVDHWAVVPVSESADGCPTHAGHV